MPQHYSKQIGRPFRRVLESEPAEGRKRILYLMRTAPLWALRTRNRLMHDGLSFTAREAIERHAGQASSVIGRYNALSEAQKQQLFAFLNSL